MSMCATRAFMLHFNDEDEHPIPSLIRVDEEMEATLRLRDNITLELCSLPAMSIIESCSACPLSMLIIFNDSMERTMAAYVSVCGICGAREDINLMLHASLFMKARRRLTKTKRGGRVFMRDDNDGGREGVTGFSVFFFLGFNHIKCVSSNYFHFINSTTIHC